MSTVPIACPFCGAWMRVAVQASQITKVVPITKSNQLYVKFDDQTIAHICKEN